MAQRGDISGSDGDAATLGATAGVVTDPDAAAAVGTPLVRGLAIHRYLLLQPLGHGATGEVWAAYDHDLDRKVALKILRERIGDHEQRRRALLGEAQAMARIHHTHVVAVHDVGMFDGRLYIAMEFVEGTTLRQYVARAHGDVRMILDAFVAAGRGLAAAHAAGVVHRDFKPDNVLVDEHGHVRVADFGLARAAAIEVAEGVVGTPAYMSPEHHGNAPLDARSDQFSFCVALFEALVGVRPFVGETAAELAAATVRAELPPTVARLPTRLRGPIARGLAARPDGRFASMDALLHAIERGRRSPWPVRVALVGAAATVAGVVMLGRAPGPTLERCHAGAALVGEFWRDEMVEGLTLEPGSMSVAYARTEARRAGLRVDAYAKRWATLHDEVCAEAQAADPRAAAGHDTRTRCVEDRRASLAGLVAVLQSGTVEAASIDAVLRTLPPLDECRAADRIGWDPVPDDPAVAARVAAVRERLRALRLDFATATPQQIDELPALLAEARATGFAHAIAATLQLVALVADDRGDVAAARAAAGEALHLAIAHGDDDNAARTATLIVHHLSRNADRDGEAEHWADLAAALLERAGNPPRRRADLLDAVGGLRFQREDYRGALAAFVEAERLFREAMGDDADEVHGVRANQAIQLAHMGRPGEAMAIASASFAWQTQSLGPDHTDTLRTLHVMVLIERILGAPEIMRRTCGELVERMQRAQGPRGRALADMLYNLASADVAVGDAEAARRHVEASRLAFPVRDDAFAEAQYAQLDGAIAALDGDYDRARALLDRAIDVFEHAGQIHASSAASARRGRADISLATGRWRDALADIDAAGATSLHSIGTSSAAAAVVAADALGDSLARARMLAIAEANLAVEANDLPMLRFARAVVEGRRDPQRLQEVTQLRDALRRVTWSGDVQVRLVDAWLAGAWPPAPAEAATD